MNRGGRTLSRFFLTLSAFAASCLHTSPSAGCGCSHRCALGTWWERWPAGRASAHSVCWSKRNKNNGGKWTHPGVELQTRFGCCVKTWEFNHNSQVGTGKGEECSNITWEQWVWGLFELRRRDWPSHTCMLTSGTCFWSSGCRAGCWQRLEWRPDSASSSNRQTPHSNTWWSGTQAHVSTYSERQETTQV